MKLSRFFTGPPGHPLHAPLTDVTIGAYTLSVIFGLLGALGGAERDMVTGWWLTLIAGLVLTIPTALTGLLDWFSLAWGTEVWKTATAHMVAMLSAGAVFGLAAGVGHSGFARGRVAVLPLVLTLVGFGILVVGGWLGGTLVFVHGTRVIRKKDGMQKRDPLGTSARVPDAHSGARGGPDDDRRWV